jgi:hypothetical protein
MKTKRYTFVDKSAWGAGPWLKEPDKIQWQDKATGLPCLIVRNTHCTGSLCGYVGVPPAHPLHGKGYNDAQDINVHGGLTFANKCHPLANHASICHVVEPGEDDNVWWFGFDCSHAGDVCPQMESTMRDIRKRKPELFEGPLAEPLPYRWRDVYRDVRYVRRQVRQLATQLQALA